MEENLPRIYNERSNRRRQILVVTKTFIDTPYELRTPYFSEYDMIIDTILDKVDKTTE